jgi:hypothetical protein
VYSGGSHGRTHLAARKPTFERLPGLLALLALVAFAVGLLLYEGLRPPRAAGVHVVLAVGAMPLIFGAMLYFTPVLTRGAAAPVWTLLGPALALGAGALAVASIVTPIWWITQAAALGLAACLIVLGWMWGRARAMLGSPHPGLHWYAAALSALALGLVAIGLTALLPTHWVALRGFHVHANLLGFVGLTAIGTLRVLLPTAAGYSDPRAAAALRGDLPYALGGTLLVAIGAAGVPLVAWIGLILWAIVLLPWLASLLGRWRHAVWGWHGSATALGGAAFGWAAVLGAGALQGAGLVDSDVPLRLFFLAFLLPLVTGATGHLLPLWLWPDRPPAWQQHARDRLTYASGVRTAGFLITGVLAAAGAAWAAYLAAALAGSYLLQVLQAARTRG